MEPKIDRDILEPVLNLARKYFELALLEFELNNTRYANTLYRKGKKYYPDPTAIPKTVREYHKLLNP